MGTISQRLVASLKRPVSDALRRRAALHVLDWLGCAIAARTSRIGTILRAHAQSRGGGSFSLATGGQGSIDVVLLVNGALGSVLEMDDVDKRALLHPGPVVIPAALAVAEAIESPPADVLDAIIRGYEALIRLGRAVGPGHYARFHNTGTCGPLGAAVAAGWLLGLSDEALVHAIGNAVTQGAGLWQVRHEPVMSKSLHMARAAGAGVTAAELAARGFTGPAAIFEGPQGFFAGLCPDGAVEKIVPAAEEDWALCDVSFKPWPACRHAHAAIDAALVLHERLRGRTLTRIDISTYADAVAFCDQASPRSELEAKFSLQHAVAVALGRGRPGLEDFSPAAISDPGLTALRSLCHVRAEDAISRTFPEHFGASISVIDMAGERHSASVPDALGDPENPLSEDGIIEKARALLRHGGLSLSDAEALIDAAVGLGNGAPLEAVLRRMRAV